MIQKTSGREKACDFVGEGHPAGCSAALGFAGICINTDIAASLEYACYVAGSKVVAIIGHTGCGAVKGACDRVTVGNLPGLLARIEPAVRATETAAGEDRTSHNHEFVDRVARANVVHSVQTLRRISPLLAKMEAEGKLPLSEGCMI